MTTPGKGKGKKKRGDDDDNVNTPNKKGKSNADANTKNAKVEASPSAPGQHKDLVKTTKTHLTIQLPATKYLEAKVLNIPFKELKTLTGLEREDRCWPYCVTAMLYLTKHQKPNKSATTWACAFVHATRAPGIQHQARTCTKYLNRSPTTLRGIFRCAQ